MDLVTYALAKKYTEDTVKGAGALKGQDGDSAYQVAVKNGFVGTEQEWLDSLDGPEGKAGVSPVVMIEPTSDGNQVNITDAEGTKSFEVKNGGTSSYVTEVKLMVNKWADNTQKATSEIFKAGEQYIYTVTPSEETEKTYIDSGIEAFSVDDTGMTFRCLTVPGSNVLAKINRTQSQIIEPTYPKNVAVIRNRDYDINTLGSRSNGSIDVGAKVLANKNYELSFHWKITFSDCDLPDDSYGNFYIFTTGIFQQTRIVRKIFKGRELVGRTVEGDYNGILQASITDLEGLTPMLIWDCQNSIAKGTITNLEVIEKV